MTTKRAIFIGIAAVILILLLKNCYSDHQLNSGKKTVNTDNQNRKTTSNDTELIRLKESAYTSRLDSIKAQHIKVNIKGEKLVTCEQGTLLALREDTFLDKNGKAVQDNIDLEIKELQYMDQFIQAGLTTTSGEKLLSTAGSYYINASRNGEPLTINPKKGLKISFPTQRKDKNMQLFKGVENEEGKVDWLPLNQTETPFVTAKPIKSKFTSAASGIIPINDRKRFIYMIDNYYTKKGDKWIPNTNETPSTDSLLKKTYLNMEYYDDFVSKVRVEMDEEEQERKELAYIEKKLRYEQQKTAYDNALNTYYQQLERRGIKAPKSDVSAYEYTIMEVGWYNCDKFVNKLLVLLSGKILDENQAPASWSRVHLVSRTENVHLLSIANENGDYTFSYPKDLPFEIYTTRDGKEGRLAFDKSTKNQNLGSITIQ